MDSDERTLVDEQSRASGPPDLVGETLDGRYYIEQKLGSGGIGDVYLARDKPALMSRRVVVKVLQEKALQDEWLVTKFRQEVEALTRIDDPGVVGLLDAGTLSNGHPYLVMQFVEGDNLRSVMRPDRGMDFDDVADIWQKIGRTLSAAHDCEVIHRDLKPENIMVRQRPDGSWQVKVIDFGIARIRNSLVAPSTVNSRVAGTVSYMSPEQVDGKKAFAVSDVYALGIIAYELVTGRRPFNPETAFQLSELQKTIPVSPRALRPALPLAAEKAILKALAYRGSDRYQRACDFGDDLASALRTEDEDTLRKSRPSKVDDHSVSDEASILTKLATVEAAADGGAAPKRGSAPTLVDAKGEMMSASRQASAETQPTPRSSWLVWLSVGLLSLSLAATIAWIAWPKLLGSERSLTYWLTVQRMYDGKSLGQPFNATGRDYFHTGDRFFLNIVADEAGALYLIDEGHDDKGAIEWNIVFPTKEYNKGAPTVAAHQNITTGWYRFTGSTGVEQVWLIWSVQRNAQLDSVFRDAIADGVIHDVEQQAQLREFLKRYESPQTELIQDETTERAALKGRGDVLVQRLDFSHKP